MNKKVMSLGLAIIISGSLLFSSVEAKASVQPKSNSVSKKTIVKAKSKKTYDPYEWAPGVKKRFEDSIMKNGYADSRASIRYVKGGVYSKQGYYKVYAKLDGTKCYIVTVNVKTGKYHG